MQRGHPRAPGPKYRFATGFAEIIRASRPDDVDLPQIQIGIVLQHQRSGKGRTGLQLMPIP